SLLYAQKAGSAQSNPRILKPAALHQVVTRSGTGRWGSGACSSPVTGWEEARDCFSPYFSCSSRPAWHRLDKVRKEQPTAKRRGAHFFSPGTDPLDRPVPTICCADCRRRLEMGMAW